jgi:hypothetical protein
MSRLLLLLVFLLPAHRILGQLVLSESYYPRVVIPDHMTFRVDVPSLQIDTLIMEKASKLTFTFQSTRLKIGYAVIGKNCTWDARASETAGRGQDLDISANFERVGKLIIDTRGGRGVNGKKGNPGAPGTNGSSFGSSAGNGGTGGAGDTGGPGGDGGNLTLVYRAAFKPVFEPARKNSIVLRYDGGDGGQGGEGGEGGPGSRPVGRQYEGTTGTVKEIDGVRGENGRRGPTGFAGKKGADGILKLEKIL